MTNDSIISQLHASRPSCNVFNLQTSFAHPTMNQDKKRNRSDV